VIQKERLLRLALNIEAKTETIHDAIQHSLAYEITKNSPSLGREATYNVTAQISRWVGGWVVERVGGQMGGWVGGEVGGCVDGWVGG